MTVRVLQTQCIHRKIEKKKIIHLPYSPPRGFGTARSVDLSIYTDALKMHSKAKQTREQLRSQLRGALCGAAIREER